MMNDTGVLELEAQETLRPETDIVAAQVPILRTRLKEMLGHGARLVQLDLVNVRMVDSAGIGLIISTHNSLKKVGARLELTGVAPEIGDLFRSMRMHQHFRISGVE